MPHARWTIAPAAREAATPGATIHLKLVAEIDPGWHIYALSQPSGGPTPLSVTLAPPARAGSGTDRPFALDGVIISSPPTRAFDQNFGVETVFHEKAATLTLPVKIAAGTPAASTALRVTVRYQACNDRQCMLPINTDLDLTIPIGSRLDPGLIVAGVPRLRAGSTPGIAAGGAASLAAAKPAVPDMAAASATSSTLAGYVGLAALMGALSLLTPCVFPMVPITVSYFTNRAQKHRRRAVAQALVYGAGIVLTFTAVGFTLAVGFGASGLNRFAANPWLNLGVTALFLTFALNLFGAFELALPSSVVNAASRAESGRGQYAGAMLMGLAFTLTSFTCTAPFLGTLLVVAAAGQWQWPLAGMLAFSTVFATPFVVLALAPQLVASLPRSGKWLLAVKAAMGLLEIAAAMKFLSNVDLVWNWGIFTRVTVLIVWIVVALVMAAYFLGTLRLGHAQKLGRPGAFRGVISAAAIALAIWLGAGLLGRNLGELEAFLPPANSSSVHAGDLTWITNDYDAALAEAKRTQKPIFIDFTGYTCTNCRWMEANMFPRPEVARELTRYVRVRLYTDGQGEMYERYQAMQQNVFGTVALPYYAAMTSDGRPVVAFGGLTRNPSEFIAFLRKGLE